MERSVLDSNFHVVSAAKYNEERNYANVDRKTAFVVEKAALSETIRVWSIESIGPPHLATAAAGMMFMTIYGTSGADKLALPNVLQARHLAINMQLFNHDTAWKVYSNDHPQRSRARAILAWGMYMYLAYVSVISN